MGGKNHAQKILQQSMQVTVIFDITLAWFVTYPNPNWVGRLTLQGYLVSRIAPGLANENAWDFTWVMIKLSLHPIKESGS